MRERGRRAGANAGSLTGGGALTRRRPGSDAGAGAAAPAAAAEKGEGQGSRLVVVVGGSLVSFSWGVVGVRVDARSLGWVVGVSDRLACRVGPRNTTAALKSSRINIM